MSDLSHIQNHDLERDLKIILKQETALEHDSIPILYEMYRRKLHLIRGFDSLPRYCVEHLGMTDNKAWKRSQAIRVLHQHPDLLAPLKAGQTHLSHLVLMAGVITKDNAAILKDAALTLSKRDMTAVINKLKMGLEDPEVELLSFSVTNEDAKTWRNFLVSQAGGNTAKAFALLMSLSKKSMAHANETPTSPGKLRGRYLNKDLRDAVFQRDAYQCTYLSPNGKRCPAISSLEIDHIVPYALGGENRLSNLRLLCKGHNGLAADQQFSKEHMTRKTTKSHDKMMSLRPENNS